MTTLVTMVIYVAIGIATVAMFAWQMKGLLAEGSEELILVAVFWPVLWLGLFALMTWELIKWVTWRLKRANT